MTRLAFLLALVAIPLGPAPRARAAGPQPVDLQLVLAVDASGSVDNDRFQLQKHGYATAFRTPSVVDAIRGGANQAIEVTMVQWTGPTLHVVVIPWTRITDTASANALADAIDAAPRALYGGGTSLSGAIEEGVQLLQQAPGSTDGVRRVIDISGDGSNNRGGPAADARDAAVKQGIAINGLPILTLEPDLDTYYRDNVIGGPGAFVIAVTAYDQFAAAILRKLINEIAALPGQEGQGALPPAPPAKATRPLQTMTLGFLKKRGQPSL